MENQGLTNYLEKNGGEPIFDEFRRLKILTGPTRKKLVHLAYCYLTEHGSPTEAKKIAVSHSIIELFPILKVPNSKIGGIVSFA